MSHSCSTGNRCSQPAADTGGRKIFSLFLGQELSNARLVFDDVLAAIRSAGVDTDLAVLPMASQDLPVLLTRARREGIHLVLGSGLTIADVAQALALSTTNAAWPRDQLLPAALIVSSRWPGPLFRLANRKHLLHIKRHLARYGYRVSRVLAANESGNGLSEPGPLTRVLASLAGQRLAGKAVGGSGLTG